MTHTHTRLRNGVDGEVEGGGEGESSEGRAQSSAVREQHSVAVAATPKQHSRRRTSQLFTRSDVQSSDALDVKVDPGGPSPKPQVL